MDLFCAYNNKKLGHMGKTVIMSPINLPPIKLSPKWCHLFGCRLFRM